MKAKLLREVRKRYKIYRYPNGFDDGPFLHTTNLSYVLRDSSQAITYHEARDMWNEKEPIAFVHDGKYVTEKEIIQVLKDRMLREILREYKNKGVRRIKRQQVRNTIYYNENITNK